MEKAIRRKESLGNARTGDKTVVPVMFVSRVNGPVDVAGSGVMNICETVAGLSPSVAVAGMVPSDLKFCAELKITKLPLLLTMTVG
jgi:hypothetical protein